MTSRLFNFQIQMKFIGKSKEMVQTASNKTLINKPSHNQYLGLRVNCKNCLREMHAQNKSCIFQNKLSSF